MHPRSKHWHLIDYVIVRCADINDVLLTRAMRGAECCTGHCMIMTKLHIKVRSPQRLQKSSKRRLHCAQLRKAKASDEFHCLTAEKQKVIEPLLRSEDPMVEK
ncbi:hypothetical protein AAFF_G00366730 [Aldrovandia affinis]|uniref:Uncharacterized protein n=1 Tax=Aldrovandia affinis TaxID=143900 RepID=A0AAD7SHD6_9TELE|nr:hypothetical protein AAFF_G00366730 [Aldrovandia affinis]